MKIKWLFISIIVLLPTIFQAQDISSIWRQELKAQLALLGHRNWILVVDAAYPLQSKSAIKTIVTGAEHLDVVRGVLESIDKALHVNSNIFLDKEIDFVTEEDAKGIKEYTNKLAELLKGKNINKELHEDLIATIDQAAETFNILVLKTNFTIPYTSVFFQLDCGYWNAEQEMNLRELMK